MILVVALASTSCGSDDEEVGGEGAVCGGGPFLQAPPPCAGDLFCDYDIDDCGRVDGGGICARPPTSCQPDDAPVRGCDGIGYANACEAHRAGTDVQRQGLVPR